MDDTTDPTRFPLWSGLSNVVLMFVLIQVQPVYWVLVQLLVLAQLQLVIALKYHFLSCPVPLPLPMNRAYMYSTPLLYYSHRPIVPSLILHPSHP